MRVTSGHSLRRQEWGDPMRVASENVGSEEGVIVTSHIAWEWECPYMYKHTVWWRVSQYLIRACPQLWTHFYASFPFLYLCTSSPATILLISSASSRRSTWWLALPFPCSRWSCSRKLSSWWSSSRRSSSRRLQMLVRLLCSSSSRSSQFTLGWDYSKILSSNCILSCQSFHSSCQSCYAILISAAWEREWWR